MNLILDLKAYRSHTYDLKSDYKSGYECLQNQGFKKHMATLISQVKLASFTEMVPFRWKKMKWPGNN